jgi:hypothetical protein
LLTAATLDATVSGAASWTACPLPGTSISVARGKASAARRAEGSRGTVSSSTDRPAVERVHPPDAIIRLVNPVIRRLLASPLHRAVSGQLMLLRYTSRRSGRRFRASRRSPGPRGAHRRVHELGLAPQLPRRPRGRARQPEAAGRRAGHACRGRVDDVDEVVDAYERRIEALGWEAAQRRLGIRVNVGRAPTRDELADAVRRSGLSIVLFDPT